MKLRRPRLLLAIAVLVVAPLFGPAASMQRAAKRPLEVEDVIAWKAVGSTVLSNDGQWFAYRLAPQEGDGEVVIKRVRGDNKEQRFPIGEQPAEVGGGGRGGAGTPPSTLAFSEDGTWVAFTTYPTRLAAQRLKRQKRPIQSGVTVVNVATGDKKEYPKIRRFAFSGESAGWIALHRYGPDAPPGAAGGAPAAAGTGGRGGAAGGAAPDRPRGADLILRELASGAELNVGNVSEFSFRKDGRLLAFAIDAQDKAGNGLQVRDMTTGTVSPVDSGSASYERITWTDRGDALAVLRGTDDKAYRDKFYAVVGITDVTAAAPRKTVFDPATDPSVPKGMTISPNRDPQWTDDLKAIVFGLYEPRLKDATDESSADAPAADAASPAPDSTASAANAPNTDEKVDLVLWHYKDPRLQTQQEVQEARDRAFNYAAEYRVDTKKFIRLANEEMRNVTVNTKCRWAVGTDDREYELLGSLDGRRFEDIYAVDLTTGARKPVVKHLRYFSGASPDGSKILYFENGDYHVYSLATGEDRNITQGLPVSFVDVEDDHNEVKPPVNAVGWASDNKTVLLTDAWDIWQVPVEGGQAVNLTVNGKKDGIRYQQRFALEPPSERADGIDLSKPQFFRAYGEWTKKGGLARVEPRTPGARLLAWSDASYQTMMKAKKADAYLFTRGSSTEPSDYYATEASLADPVRITDQRPQVEPFAWSPGVQLVNYTSDKGDKLQAALFLPANYEKGKSYPTVVNFYEKMSQTANQFSSPAANGFNRSVYTSNGYAVFVPDITYRVNDPGMSAVWCMVPAVKAAIATGIVDPKHIGITGHSWGGYQTAFLVTQTDLFAAAVAGAPLTDMVSMYSLVYKNSGGWNGAIFESSQGRFKGGYWDNWDAYYRNSPVFFAKNVHTPLMILHNDKDGAVDFTQGVEYFNTLRRMQKPVIMLEYIGENHSLAKRANQRDYTVRMMEFFDHYLKGAPAPDWMVNGVPRLKMEDHLKERAKPKTPAKKITTTAEGGRS
ncbi:MAG TPA: prolyl oligopeptidase family serine peptidase [Vicinamibacterales bacterium]|nr:prolyl oligopeptidase family serine peptidase [Vicinamibacterales bacterium]